MASRTQYILKNAKVSVFCKTLSLVLGFVSRTLFIHFLGTEYLGINGLYSEILQILNFTELGFGTALTFAMYSPIASNDEKKIIQLLNVYKKAYRIIAIIVSSLGTILLPFLPYIIKGAETIGNGKLRIYFIFFLANTVATYFVAYKTSYVSALQKNYVCTIIDTVTNFFVMVLQIVAIAITKNYIVYLAVHTISILLSKLIISIYLNKQYPILKEKTREKLEDKEYKSLFKDIKGLLVHKFSSVAVHATDNIIISTFLSVVVVGVVSNYNLIITSVIGFVSLIFSSMTASYGNLAATSSEQSYKQAFLDVNYVNFWIYGFCSIAFFVLIPPFITLWLGESYLIDTVSFLLIIINCYLQGQTLAYSNARDASGNYSIDKWCAFSQAIINLLVSVFGAMYLGLVGVYIGTVVSRIVYLASKVAVTYKFLFNAKPKEYYLKLICYFFIVGLTGFITYIATRVLINSLNYLTFIVMCLIVAVIPNLMFLLFTFNSTEQKNLIKRVKKLLKKADVK